MISYKYEIDVILNIVFITLGPFLIIRNVLG